MKYLLIAALAILISHIAFAQPKKIGVPKDTTHSMPAPQIPEVRPEVFSFVSMMPRFPGDSEMAYIEHNIRYPEEEKQKHITLRALVKIIVMAGGSITDAMLPKSTGYPAYDKEALRVVNSMPKWIPGKQNGMPVNVYTYVPVFFKP